jgi:LPS sulfotransferase NodH
MQRWPKLFDPFDSLDDLHTSYLICATPRSGSTLLCEALLNTGLAGRPWEYFFEWNEPTWYAEWQVSTYEDYVARAVRQSTTPNGVCGVKLMIGYLGRFIAKVRETPRFSARELGISELLSEIFPNLHYIWITRRHKVRQAVSWEKAIQTGAWAHGMTPTREPEYQFDAIDRRLDEITLQESGWQEFFHDHAITPLTVVYEDLETHYEETAARILDALRIPYPAPLAFDQRVLRKQADEGSEAWVQRYMAEKQASARIFQGYPFRS